MIPFIHAEFVILSFVTQYRMSEIFDLIVIGAGPSGLVTALWAARQGLTICVIDKRWTRGTWACRWYRAPDVGDP